MSELTNRDLQPDLDRQHIVTLIGGLRSFEQTVREAAFQQLQLLDRQVLMHTLISILCDREGAIDERCDAILALIKLDPHTGVPLVLPFLKDPDSDIRQEVCEILHLDAEDATEHAISPLIDVVLTDEDVDVRLAAIIALRKFGDKSALPALRHAQHSDHGVGRQGHYVADLAAEAMQSIEARDSLGRENCHVEGSDC